MAGVVIYLVITLLSGGGLGQLGTLNGQRVGSGGTPGEIAKHCQTGADANQRQDCRIVAVVNSVQKFWAGVFQREQQAVPLRRHGLLHRPGADRVRGRQLPGRPVLLSERRARLHRPRLLRRAAVAFGVGAAPFTEAYVLAHEYGHHVQDQLGILKTIGNDRQGPESKAVRSELQADCYAGVWAAHAVETRLVEQLTQNDINSGLDAAAAIGDDRIQEQTQGQVNPETWTHGSSEQRRRWFSRGYERGKPAACDTFSGSI